MASLFVCFSGHKPDLSRERDRFYAVLTPSGAQVVKGFWKMKRMAKRILHSGTDIVPYLKLPSDTVSLYEEKKRYQDYYVKTYLVEAVANLDSYKGRHVGTFSLNANGSLARGRFFPRNETPRPSVLIG